MKDRKEENLYFYYNMGKHCLAQETSIIFSLLTNTGVLFNLNLTWNNSFVLNEPYISLCFLLCVDKSWEIVWCCLGSWVGTIITCESGFYMCKDELSTTRHSCVWVYSELSTITSHFFAILDQNRSSTCRTSKLHCYSSASKWLWRANRWFVPRMTHKNFDRHPLQCPRKNWWHILFDIHWQA